MPNVYTCGKPLVMQSLVGLYHVSSKPGATLFVSVVSLAATYYDVVEGFVEGDMISLVVDKCAHAVADMYLLREDDESVERAEPQYLIVFLETVPWKDAVAVSQQQAVDAQIAAYGYQSVLIAFMRVGKGQDIFIQSPDGHLSL